MRQIRFNIIILLCFFSLSGTGQQGNPADLLDEAFRARMRSDQEGNLKYLMRAQAMIPESETELRTRTMLELSKHYLIQGRYDSSKFYADSSLRLAEDSGSGIALASAYLTQATYFNYLNAGELAVENAQRTLELLRNDPEPALEARAYYILYGIYSGWDNLELCEKYANLAAQCSRQASDHELLANSLNAKAVVMEYKYSSLEDRTYLDSVPYYLRESMKVFKDNPQGVAIRTYAISNVNMANHFFRFRDPANSSTQDSIIHYAGIAQKIYQRYDRNYDVMANVNGLLAEVASLRGDIQAAERYLLSSLSNLEAAGEPSYYNLSNVAQGLSDLYKKRGDYRQALTYQKKKEEFSQKIFDSEEMVQINKLEAQYENKRLASEIQESEKRAHNRRIQLLLLAGVCVCLLISLLLLRSAFKNKHRLQLERNLRLKEQKKDMIEQSRLQLLVQQEEQARLASEQKLLNIQMEQMQKESMADALQIERKNRLLMQLREKLKKLETGENTGYIDRMIKEEMRLEERVESSSREFKNIHPGFFQKLKELSADKLSTLELKHCAYVHLKLSTKEIAAAFHIEPKSVRVSKYRIKQKLKLDREVDLDGFLQGLGIGA